jgi:hypothetical protein
VEQAKKRFCEKIIEFLENQYFKTFGEIGYCAPNLLESQKKSL